MEKQKPNNPRVLLLGRTNVGKSTFFKRITEKDALIMNTPHTTRDTKSAEAEWNRVTFTLTDTGGFDIQNDDPFKTHVTERTRAELLNSDLVLLMVDSVANIETFEQPWMRYLKQLHKKTFLVINKVDRPHERVQLAGRRQKGFPTYAISSVNGGGLGDLLDAITESFAEQETGVTQAAFTFGLVGNTNVGKSSLFNALNSDISALVHDTHHTTRESQSVFLKHKGMTIELVDTVGVQHKPKNKIQKFGQMTNDEVLSRSDVLGLVTVPDQPSLSSQEIKLAHRIIDARRSLIIIMNKWDLVPNPSDKKQREVEAILRKSLQSLSFVPVILASATKKLHIPRILDQACKVFDERFFSLSEQATKSAAAPFSDFVKNFTQIDTNPPRFQGVGRTKSIPTHVSYALQKAIRKEHPYLGTPLVVSIIKKPKKYAFDSGAGKS